jgi:Raf kinase inhibitor-like YbhB/YbcL family protein
MLRSKTKILNSVVVALLGAGMMGCESDRIARNDSDLSRDQMDADAIVAGYREAPRDDTGILTEPKANQVIAISQPATECKTWLTVNSDSFQHNQTIPDRFTAAGKGLSPDLEWSKVPEGTRSFAIIVEDADAAENGPFTHWVVYNLPGNLTRLQDSVEPEGELYDYNDALQGTNSMGTIGYVGPMKPNARDHSYYFQVFALDSTLDLGPGATKDQVIKAMDGHVLAKGLIMGVLPAK